METASFGLPTVNVGIRQHGRERPGNVVDAGADAAEIVATLRAARSSEFRESLRGMSNPYGDGTASEKIAEVLTSVPLGKKLLRKRAVPLAEEAILD
jgi:UDP-N-acetylglucosamine 2-epimerase (non-hydrolysing)/GDP/UDP-N,N'-diacetylbacillosamine 2-epimerase (hydrolysing)